jgi:hypothetical protein
MKNGQEIDNNGQKYDKKPKIERAYRIWRMPWE